MALSNALKTDINQTIPVIDKKESVKSPAEAPDDLSGANYLSAPTKAAYQRQQEALTKKSKVDTELASLKSDLESKVLQEKAAVTKESAEREKGYIAEYEKDSWAEPAFNPKKNNLMELGKLFSMIATMGIMSGGEGKLGSLRAMNAMTGMLKGYHAGDIQEYQNQLDIYKSNINTIKQHNAQILTHLENAQKLEATNREAALVEREQAVRLAGSSSILAKQIESGEYDKAYETAKGVFTLLEKNDAAIQAATEADQRAKDTREFNRKTQEIIAGIRAANTGSKDAYGFGDIVATASNEATASLGNLVMMPIDISSGLFGGREIDSIWGSPINVLTNSLTSESTQRYNSEINNFGKFIAQVQKGGRAVTNADIQTTAAAFKIKEGDGPLTALTKLAGARQALDRALDVRIASPRTPDELKNVYRQNKQDIERVVPFTVADINKIASSKDKTKTFGQLFVEMFEQGTVTEEDIQETMAQNGLTRDETIAALKQQGYTVRQ